MPYPIGPDLVRKLNTVADPALSPDGSRLAFTISRVDEATGESHTNVMMMDLPDGEPSQFTSGTTDKAPRFSPDGQTIGFLRHVCGVEQLWVIPALGGESRQLTYGSGRITEFAWAPDSRRFVIVCDVDADQSLASEGLYPGPVVKVVRRIRYRADTIGWRGDAFRQLFIVDFKTGEMRQLTYGEGEDSSPTWSPDGARIAFISDRRADRDISSATEAYVVPVIGGEPEQWSQGLSEVAAVTWSPDSKRLAVIGSDRDEVGAGWQGWLFLLDQDRPPRKLTDDSIKPTAGSAPIVAPPEIRWTNDDRILLLAEVQGESYLYELSHRLDERRQVAGGGAQLGTITFDSDGSKAVVTATPPMSSGDLRLINIQSGSEVRLTRYNDEYFRDHPVARLRKFKISRGGLEIESRLFMPPGFERGKMYPLVLDIHGGPHGVFYDTFLPIQQVLATSGYLVLAVNPRGSSSYGVDFMTAVLGDWGGEDYLDIMAAVDEACSLPYVDLSRLGITGYSYGGFMSSWIIGHDTRFKAAVVGAPVTNLSSMYGTSDIGVRFGEVQWGGQRKDVLAAYLEHSPLTYAANVETPVLLLHGEDDSRCPIEQSEQYFVALKRLGKNVEFVRFPGSSHSFVRGGHPRLREAYLARMLGWFDLHLGINALMESTTGDIS